MKLLIKQRVFSWTDSYDIYDENGNVDMEASRRVEIRFSLTDEQMINEMRQILDASDTE